MDLSYDTPWPYKLCVDLKERKLLNSLKTLSLNYLLLRNWMTKDTKCMLPTMDTHISFTHKINIIVETKSI